MLRIYIPVFIFLLFANGVLARSGNILYAELGVNGLTCSQCSRSVEMKLRKLDFVKNVSMNLEHTNGTIFFEDGKVIDFTSIAKAVTDAGFSVRYLRITSVAAGWKKSGEYCYSMDGNTFQLVGKMPVKDTLQLQMLGSNFMPPAAVKKWKAQLITHCTAQAYFVIAN
ncbi:heavy-metal-associated domain-containing protein [Chitinophagaceae bacterium MMS25-I14]